MQALGWPSLTFKESCILIIRDSLTSLLFTDRKAEAPDIDLFRAASQVALVLKNLPASAGDIRDTGSIPGPGAKILHASRQNKKQKT